MGCAQPDRSSNESTWTCTYLMQRRTDVHGINFGYCGAQLMVCGGYLGAWGQAYLICDQVDAKLVYVSSCRTCVLGYAWVMLIVLRRKILSPSRATVLSGHFKAHLGVQCGHFGTMLGYHVGAILAHFDGNLKLSWGFASCVTMWRPPVCWVMHGSC